MSPSTKSSNGKGPSATSIGLSPNVKSTTMIGLSPNNGANCCSGIVPKDKAGGSETSARKVPETIEIVINGQVIKSRILATGKSYMNTQLVQILCKVRAICKWS